MEVQGKIIAILTPRSGESKRNPGETWMSQEYVVETHDQYSRKMVFTVFGQDRIQRFNIQLGQEVTVSFDIDAHDWNGRWFNDIRAYDVRQIDPASVGATGAAPFAPAAAPFPPAQDAVQAPQAAAPFSQEQGTADDLPF